MNIEEELEKLRKEWKEKPSMRKIIERRAKALKYAAESKDIVEEAKEIFGINDKEPV